MPSILVESPARKPGFRPRVPKTELAISAALAAAVAIAMGGCIDNGFVNYDDDIYVQNLHVQGGLQWDALVWAFQTTTSNHWHPLTWVSLQFDTELFSAGPAGFHLTNLLLHALNSILLFWFLRLASGRVYPSALVALLFAIHPLHVESVAWVTERKDVLSTFFLLLTLLAYVRYARKPKLVTYLPVLGFFVLGLLAKPMLITLPVVMLLLDYWPLQRYARLADPPGLSVACSFPGMSFSRLVLEKLPLAAIALASAWVSLHARQHGGGLKSGVYLSFEERLSSAILAATAYLGDLFWPQKLAIYYPLPEEGFSPVAIVASSVLLACLTIAAFAFARSRPYLLVGWLFYLATLSPVSGLVQLGSYARADRYTYVPLIGIFIALSWGAADLLRKAERRARGVERNASLPARLALLVGVALLAACIVSSRRQVEYWRDSVTLWEHALQSTPDNFYARIKLAQALQAEGRDLPAHENFQQAVALRPDLAVTHTYLGQSYFIQGRYQEAIDCLQAALKIDPGFARAQVLLERALQQQRRGL